MTPLLELNAVTSGYGKVPVVKAVSISVESGEIVTVIGANGAGKSTLLRTISRFLTLHSGSISFDGADLGRLKPHELAAKGIAHVPEGRRVFPRLTTYENLELGAFSRSAKPDAAGLEMIFELFPVLKERRNQLAGTLSGGEQQMLAVGRALMSKPRLMLLDEPSMGVAPLLVERIFETIRTLNREGMTILLVEQNAHLALQIANRGYVLELGEVILADAAGALLSNPKVQEAYLGA